MARTLRLRRMTPPVDADGSAALSQVIEKFEENPQVEEYGFNRNKKTGLVTIQAVTDDKTIITHEQIGCGLSTTTLSVRTGITPAEKRTALHDNICALHRKNYRQVDIASHLGCSQSLVSKVLRERGEI